MTKPTLVVLAAGIGNRYGGLKQLDPVGPSGEIILDYSVYDALAAGFGKVVLVVRAGEASTEHFRAEVEKTFGQRCEVVFADQDINRVPDWFTVPAGRSKPWGTAHAALSCQGLIDEPCAVINADDFYGPAAYRILFDYLKAGQADPERHDWCMVGYVLENTLTKHGHVTRGVCSVDRDGFLVRIDERQRVERWGTTVRYAEDDRTEADRTWITIPGDSVASMNFWGFWPGFFDQLESRFDQFLRDNASDLSRCEFLLPKVVSELIAEGRATVRVLPTTDRWFGVTFREDRAPVQQAITNLVEQGQYPEQLW